MQKHTAKQLSRATQIATMRAIVANHRHNVLRRAITSPLSMKETSQFIETALEQSGEKTMDNTHNQELEESIQKLSINYTARSKAANIRTPTSLPAPKEKKNLNKHGLRLKLDDGD
jgi:hypothetical protein